MTREEKDLIYLWVCRRLVPEKWIDGSLSYGAIIAQVELVGCHLIPRMVEPWFEKEMSFGDYAVGRWAWMTQNLRAFSEPIPWRGARGLFDVPSSILSSPIPE